MGATLWPCSLFECAVIYIKRDFKDHCHIQSVEWLVRMNQITKISATTALVLSQRFRPHVLEFSAVIKRPGLTKLKVMWIINEINVKIADMGRCLTVQTGSCQGHQQVYYCASITHICHPTYMQIQSPVKGRGQSETRLYRHPSVSEAALMQRGVLS